MPQPAATAAATQEPRRRESSWAWLCAGLMLLVFSALAHADSYDERRVRTGARLLRSLLAADLGLDAKAASAGGTLTVWVIGGDPRLAREVAELIAPADTKAALVRGLPLRVELLARLPAGTPDKTSMPVALYLAGNPDPASLPGLIQWTREQQVILFSPFEGHVERGVASGLAIGAKVQPLLGSAALQAAGIELKPFFLKVAKVLP